MPIWTSVVSSIDGLADDVGEFSSPSPFLAIPWLRFLESLPLDDVVGGTVEPEYVVVGEGSRVAAVCPFLRVRGEEVYFLYSLRRFFFENCFEEAARMRLDAGRSLARLSPIVSAMRSGLERLRGALSDCLIVGSPLAYRGGALVAEGIEDQDVDWPGLIVNELRRVADRRRAPLWAQGSLGDASIDAAMTRQGFERTFLFYDNVVRVDGFESFGDYLRSFRRTTRRGFEREMWRTEHAGVDYTFTRDWDAHADDFARLYERTYRKHGDSHFQHPPWFWRRLGETMGDDAEAIAARKDDEVIGFSALLHDRERGELWTYRIGRRDDGELAETPFYFGLSFYGPIRRAIELGYRRVWLGPVGYEAKRARGADVVPIYNHFYFPRRVDNWLLKPYLRLFGKISREQIDQSLRPAPRRVVATRRVTQGYVGVAE